MLKNNKGDAPDRQTDKRRRRERAHHEGEDPSHEDGDEEQGEIEGHGDSYTCSRDPHSARHKSPEGIARRLQRERQGGGPQG